MKEPKVKKVEELKLQIEELEERIAPGIVSDALAIAAGSPPGASAPGSHGGQVAGRWLGLAGGVN